MTKRFGLEDEPLRGVANIGSRPTVAGTTPRFEVHVLDFSGDIYRRHLHVDLLHKIRDEIRFDSLEALKRQIQRDVAAAREFFASGAVKPQPTRISMDQP